MRLTRLVLAGSVAGLFLGTAVTAAWSGRPYTSSAVLRQRTQQIPPSLVPADNASVEAALPAIVQTALSRGNLVNIINAHNLYPGERARRPVEDVVKQMRDSVRIVSSPAIEISFSYPDPRLAQRVTSDIAGRIITEWIRGSSLQAVLTRQFMLDSAAAAGKKWEESLAALRAAERAGAPLERAKLDADIARQRYQELSAKVAQAEMIEEMHRRQQGVTLELVDAPSLPQDWRPPFWLGAICGALIGAVLGLLLSLHPSYRPALRHGV